MFKISKQYSFSASHILEGLSQGHPCSRMHGHNYIVTIYLQSRELDVRGFVKDYRELDSIKKYIDDNLDHRHLNDVFDINPTAENLAKKLFDIFVQSIPQLYAVEISETPKTSAIYEVEC